MTTAYRPRMKKILTFMLLLAASVAATAQTLPSPPVGFISETVIPVGAASAPTALAFTPDGRMLVTLQGGVLLVKNGAAVATTALSFNTGNTGADPMICAGGERGLLGVAVDPQFLSNRFIYLFYTARNGNATCASGITYGNAVTYASAGRPVNRVSRFTLAVNDTVDPASELIIVNNMPSPGGNHNAGDVHFGKDGYLYISIGDGGSDYAGDSGAGGGNDAARDTHVLTGKILRVSKTGGIPPDNPFVGANTGICAINGATTAGFHCRETYAWGLRNPFRFSMDSNATNTRFFINDVGQGAWEEVDEAKSGADFGWYCREGAHVNSSTGKCSPTPPNMVEPIFEYPHGAPPVSSIGVTGCNSITGGAFVPNGVWPVAYDNKYLLNDFVCGAMFSIPVVGPPMTTVAAAATFATALSRTSSLRFGVTGTFVVGAAPANTQALYYTSYDFGVGRIRFETTRDVTFQSAPTGLRLTVNGVTRVTPFTVTAADGARLTMMARDQNLASNGRRFVSWTGPFLSVSRAEIYDVGSANATLTANFLTGIFVPSVDVDNDGNFDAATDGVLLVRYLFGLRGAALIDSARGANAERDATAIAGYLAALGTALDIDGDGFVTPHTDGLLVLRYLLGLRGAALTARAVATGISSIAVENNLLTVLP